MELARQANPIFTDDADAPAKQAILGAAVKLFVERGIDGVSVRDIAAATGYSNPALFRHFASKEAMAQYLFERIYAGFALQLPPLRDEPFAGQMRGTLRVYFGFFSGNLPSALYLQENLRRFWPGLPAALRAQSLNGHMRGLIRKGIDQRAIRAEVPVPLLSTAVLGLLGQFARQLYFKEFQGDALDWLDPVYRLVLQTLGAAPIPP